MHLALEALPRAGIEGASVRPRLGDRPPWHRPRYRTATYVLSAVLALVLVTACGANTSPQANGETQFDVARFDVASWE
jgi:hypothetical protein